MANSERPTFAEFWALYPRHIAKKDAARAWQRVKAEDQRAAMGALPGWREVWADKDAQFVPHAATWLNGERWADELPVRKITPPRPPTLAEQRAANIKSITGKTSNGRAHIDSTAELLDSGAVPALPGDLREQGDDHVGRRRP